jgi:glycosyltransferase involved in cell wall biosynthesis
MSLVNPNINIIRIPIAMINNHNNNFRSFVCSWSNAAGDQFYNLLCREIKERIFGMISELSIDLLIVSAPPFSLTILAEELSRKFKLPLIIDMRDAWLGWTMVPFPSYDYFLRRKFLERKVLKQATVITSVTNELIQRYKNDHPCIKSNKFKLVYNSPNKIIELNESFETDRLEALGIVNIGYTGSFYYTPPISFISKLKKPHRLFQYQRNLDNWLYRTPYYFFRILSRLFDKKPILKKKILFHYIGEPEIWFYDMIKEFRLQDNVKCHGYLKHSEVLDKEKCFDYLLITSEKTSSNNHYCLPSKIFNYLSASKPILAFVTDGPQKDLIEKVNCGLVFNPDSIDDATERLLKTFENGVKLKVNSKEFEKYELDTTNLTFTRIVHDLLEN